MFFGSSSPFPGHPLFDTLKAQDKATSTGVNGKPITSSLYLDMPDGVKLAVDITRPSDSTTEKYPTVLYSTRYWRSFQLKFGIPQPPNQVPIGPRNEMPNHLLKKGFAIVIVDVRGSGASTGVWPAPWSSKEIDDLGHVVQWICKQSWSNGRVGGTGISYEGVTSQFLPSLTISKGLVHGVAVSGMEMDLYEDITHPGGILNAAFLSKWSEGNIYLDSNRVAPWLPLGARLFVKAVSVIEESNLKQAMEDHSKNVDVYSACSNVIYKDDIFADGKSLLELSICSFQKAIEVDPIPHLAFGSWLDGNTASTVLTRFTKFKVPQIAVIGAFNHEMNANGSPFSTKATLPSPTESITFEMHRMFFDLTLRSGSFKEMFSENVLFYYTMAEEKWKQTNVWPPNGQKMQKFYFGSKNSLKTEPEESDEHDKYSVDKSTTTGTTNRWHTELLRPLYYGDRKSQDKKLLCYTSEPFDMDTEITGSASVSLCIEANCSDFAVFSYMEDVNPSGRVTFITDGQRRSIHRSGTFLKKDVVLDQNGIFELQFDMYPTSVMIKKGHRLRIALAGADKDTFLTIPEGNVEWKVYRGKDHPSSITIPVVLN
jgi:putative CocE/NonD family hydrolase